MSFPATTALRRGLRIFALAGLALAAGCATGPPVQEMSDARLAIAAARDAGAEQMASDELQQAENMLDSAEEYLQSGNYISARRDAISAKESAFEALLTARESLAQEDPDSNTP